MCKYPPQGPDPPPPPPGYEKIIWFVQIEGPGGPQTEFIDFIEPCKWYRVVATEPDQPDFTPPVCSWWHIFFPEQLYCTYFHVDKTYDQMFHIDIVKPEPIPVVEPPVDVGQGEWVPPPVGGVSVPVDKLGLLAPYIALASTIISAVVVTAVLFKRKKKQ